MSTRRGNDHSTFYLFLALDFGKIHILPGFSKPLHRGRRFRGQVRGPPQKFHDFGQALRRIHRQLRHHCGFPGIFFGNNQALQAGLAAGQGYGQHPPGRFQPAVQGYLAIEQILIQVFLGRQSLGRQEPDGDGQVKTGAVFPDIGGSQIDGNSGPGKMIAGIFNGCFDPVLALFNRNFRQPHSGEGRHAEGNIHFNFYKKTVHAPDGPTSDPG